MRGAAILLLLLAGCTAPPPADEAPRCTLTYPDGEAIDCDANLVQAPRPVDNPWVCINEATGGINGWTVTYRVLWDGADGYALGWDAHRKAGWDAVGRAQLSGAGVVLFDPRDAGMVPLGAMDGEGQVTVWTDAYRLLEPIDQTMEIRGSIWEGDAWIVLAVGSPEFAFVQGMEDHGADGRYAAGGTVSTGEGAVAVDAQSVFGSTLVASAPPLAALAGC